VVDWRHYPGPPMRSAWERQCAGPLCLPARALSSASGGSRWGRCGSRRTGSTTVNVVRRRCGFVSAAITGTCTAPGSTRGSAAGSRKGAPKRGISAAAAARGAARRPATPLARATTAEAKISDASRIPDHRDAVHRGGQSRHAEPTRRCESVQARATPPDPSTARALRILCSSTLSWRFSRRSRANSCRSFVVKPPSLWPASRSA
jgi:hypothetical protein